MNNNFTYGLSKKDFQIICDLVNAYSDLKFSQLVKKMQFLFLHDITLNHFIALGAIHSKTNKSKTAIVWQRLN
jgi:hypothetical protein